MNIIACSFIVTINPLPCKFSWPALESGGDDEGYTIAGHESHYAIAGAAESLIGKDAQEEADEGHLDHGDGSNVEDGAQIV
jgi:hypothetical protein